MYKHYLRILASDVDAAGYKRILEVFPDWAWTPGGDDIEVNSSTTIRHPDITDYYPSFKTGDKIVWNTSTEEIQDYTE
jgi:hypothetical protein